MVIRTVVVDDEKPARNELCFLLEQLDGVDIVGQASNGVDAMQVIREQKPDLVFLDIQMPGAPASRSRASSYSVRSTPAWSLSRPSTSTRSRRSR